ncbi:MAG: glycosyltransferase family 2 protein [Bacillota bacterium]
MSKKASILIPVYNEEDSVIRTLKSLNFSWIKEIIIINDASTDNTEKIIKEYINTCNKLITLYNFKRNKGKGQAIEYAFKKSIGEIIITVDADLKESVAEADKLYKHLLKNDKEMVIAIIEIKEGGFGLLHKTTDSLLYFLTKKSMRAPLSGQRVFTRELANKILPFSGGYGLELGMDIYLLRNNINFSEIECDFNHRLSKKNLSGFLHRGQEFIDIIKVFIKKWMECRIERYK